MQNIGLLKSIINDVAEPINKLAEIVLKTVPPFKVNNCSKFIHIGFLRDICYKNFSYAVYA